MDDPLTPHDTLCAPQARLLAKAAQGASLIIDYGATATARVFAPIARKSVLGVVIEAAHLAALRAHFVQTPPAARVRLHRPPLGPGLDAAANVTADVAADMGQDRRTAGPAVAADDAEAAPHHAHAPTPWRWPDYALSVWDRPDCVAADMVVVRGRFATACALATGLRCDGPVRLFIDASDAQIARLTPFFSLIGAQEGLAEFAVTPLPLTAQMLAAVLPYFGMIG